jgi:uncharacterized protein YegP (UPF0339 family)
MERKLIISALAFALMTNVSFAKEKMVASYIGITDLIEHSQEVDEIVDSEDDGYYDNHHVEYYDEDSNIYADGYDYDSEENSTDSTYQSYDDNESEDFVISSSSFTDLLNHHEENEYKVTEEFKHTVIAMIKEKIHDPYVPEDVKEILEEAKKAIKFYKKENLFVDVNFTKIDENEILKLKEKVHQAHQQRVEELKEKITKNQSKVKYPIAGEFIKYSDGAFDWVFVAQNGQVFKLDGVNPETGSFKYTYLPGVSGTIQSDGKVMFEVNSTNEIALQLATIEAVGAPFAKYNDESENNFDWFVVASNGQVYKLEGYDEDSESFVYTLVEDLTATQEDGEVEVILPGQEG